MVKFLYRATYSDDWCKLPQAECGPMAFNLKVFSAADLYDIPGLGQLAKTKLLSRLEEMADVQDFRSTIKLMYKDGEMPLDSAAIRGKVIELALREHCGSVDPVTGAVEDTAIDDLMEDFPVFGKDLLVAFMERFTLLREDAEKREQSLEQREKVLTFQRLQREGEIELSLKELDRQRAEATQRQDESLQRFRDRTVELEKKGKSFEKKEADLSKRETSIEQKEADMVKWQMCLEQKEADSVKWQTSIDQKEADLVKRETGIEQREEIYTRWYSGGELFPKIECQECGCIFVVIDEKTAIESLCCPICKTNREPERQSRWTKLKSLFSK